MTQPHTSKDLAIIGGGLAGLSLAIQCARVGVSTVLFEKEQYPRHKVCGEYISNESRAFLKALGLPIEEMALPEIHRFRLTSHHGTVSECDLKMGGFGISRFLLDATLAELAEQAGVQLRLGTRVTEVEGDMKQGFKVHFSKGDPIHCRMAVGAWGRHSGLGHRSTTRKGESWIGIKYHVDQGPAKDTIEIHAFEDGYAGLSQVENNTYCLCYLAKASGLKLFQADIGAYEKHVLAQNPFLAERLSAKRLIAPVTTSQFYFGVQPAQSHSVIGDASAFIPPLTGNGMSLALRASKHLFPPLKAWISGEITEAEFRARNRTYTQNYLEKRIRKGVFLQNLMFLKPVWLNKFMMQAFSRSPAMLRQMTQMATGEPI